MILLSIAMLSAVVPVRLVGSSGNWHLVRQGKPYFVRGAGGDGDLALLAASGGNSVRSWGAEQLPTLLREARKNHLTVAAGIWLQHSDGLNYDDLERVQRQTDRVRADVEKYRDDPSILLWGIGNEMEAGNDTPALWRGVEAAVRAAKEADPNHPVMTVVAEISREKIDHILRYAPDVDILGVNSYAGLPSMASRLKEFGWTKPYIVTEFGPRGHWECNKTAWGAPIEATSTEKAAVYRDGYEASIAHHAGWCLGSYAFLWGNKQEATPTWFGMLLPGGEPTAAVDVMQRLWTGKWPRHRAPAIKDFELAGSHDSIAPGAKLQATVRTQGKGLDYAWEVRPEHGKKGADGSEGIPMPVALEFVPTDAGAVTFHAPAQAGAYRLYVYVITNAKRAATANIPFRVTS